MTIQQRDSLAVFAANGVSAFSFTFTGMKGVTLGTRDTVTASVRVLAFRCYRYRHRRPEDIAYGVERRPSACFTDNTDTVDLKRWCTAGRSIVCVFPCWCHRHHHLEQKRQSGSRERKPIGGSPQLRSLPARAFASQRFYWQPSAARRCSRLRCHPRFTGLGSGFTAEVTLGHAIRTSTFATCVSTTARHKLEGGGGGVGGERERGEGIPQVTHPSTLVADALRRVEFHFIVYACAAENGHDRLWGVKRHGGMVKVGGCRREALSVSGAMVFMTRFDRDGRRQHQGPGYVVYGRRFGTS